MSFILNLYAAVQKQMCGAGSQMIYNAFLPSLHLTVHLALIHHLKWVILLS